MAKSNNSGTKVSITIAKVSSHIKEYEFRREMNITDDYIFRRKI